MAQGHHRRVDYATQFPGVPGIPAWPAKRRDPRARGGWQTLAHIVETWRPFTASIVNRFIGPRRPATSFASPYDVATGEDETRFGGWPSAQRPFPAPYRVGAVSGFMPMLDQWSMAFAWAATPSGPSIGTPPIIPFQQVYPDLPKQTG